MSLLFTEYRFCLCLTYRWISLPLRCWMGTCTYSWTWAQEPPRPRLSTERSMTENGIMWTSKGTDAQVHAQLSLMLDRTSTFYCKHQPSKVICHLLSEFKFKLELLMWSYLILRVLFRQFLTQFIYISSVKCIVMCWYN